ncbi:sulfatase-like hydrolase/transferase [Flammeovirga sp. SubArs3]|uniref:sulfatase-like hydrolase/transferase n=1 Tax=Flammeovirga sp. SubArs3 TaxID=2995316 RepID=UPI00248D22E0|nr:sulfatase-like hydrolase/transferase [Flammeovirga sp. SubArs3]
MTNFRSLLFSLLLFLSSSSLYSQHKNAVFIIIDDLNDYIGVMGGHPQSKTPNIDRLASQGVYFSNAHSNAPICAPSRASFLSGLYPSTTGNFAFDDISQNPILNNTKYLMEYAVENGFQTYTTGKIFHKSKDNPIGTTGFKPDQGPHAWDGTNTMVHPSIPEPFRSSGGVLDATFAPLSDIPEGGWRNNYDAKTAFRYISDMDRDKMADENNADYIVEMIDRHEAMKEEGNDQPFFMFYGGMKPHTPHVAPQSFFDKFPLETLMLPEILEDDLKDTYREHYNNSSFDKYEALLASYATEEEGIKRYLQSKLACTAFADSLIGVVVNKIENSSFADNTMIVLVSDHGFHVGEKFYLAKNTLWEESTRIPMIMKVPGYEVSKGKEVTHPVSLIDIYPTFKDLLGMDGDTKKSESGAELDGHSLRAFLENPNTMDWEGPNAALESVHNPHSDDIGQQNYALRSEKYRYIRYGSGKEEFYNHTKDPNEWRNEIENPLYTEEIQGFRIQLQEMIPHANFINTNYIPYSFYDLFEAYDLDYDLTKSGYSQKDPSTKMEVIQEGNNKFARCISQGEQVNFRMKVKDLVPGQLYFWEGKLRCQETVNYGAFDSEINTSVSLTPEGWESFSLSLRPDAEKWNKGLALTPYISTQNFATLDVDDVKVTKAEVDMLYNYTVDKDLLVVGETYKFEAVATPNDQAISWSVDHISGEAMISNEGMITPTVSGTCLVKASMTGYEDVYDSLLVTIWDDHPDFTLSIDALTDSLEVEYGYQLHYSLSPSLNQRVIWSVDDESVAVINKATGFIIGKSRGKVNVIAKLYDDETVFTTLEINIGKEGIISSIDDNIKDNIRSQQYFTVYPNPSTGTFIIDGDGLIAKYHVYNSLGILIKSAYSDRLDLSGQQAGLYYLVLENGEVKKLIKR